MMSQAKGTGLVGGSWRPQLFGSLCRQNSAPVAAPRQPAGKGTALIASCAENARW
jgi:hypothetical protein